MGGSKKPNAPLIGFCHPASVFRTILKQLHRQRGVFWPTPAIALKAADEPPAVVVDLDQRVMAVGVVSATNCKRLGQGDPLSEARVPLKLQSP